MSTKEMRVLTIRSCRQKPPYKQQQQNPRCGQ